MKQEYSAAIYLLSSRTTFVYDCLKYLYENFNYKYDLPVYIHYFDDIYPEKFQEKIRSDISSNIHFIQIEYGVPDDILEKELFYNRKEIPYVRECFPKERIGYLHMEYFVSNLTSFGEVGCLCSELEKYDYLIRIDDDSWFKEKIEIDLFDKAAVYPLVTGYAWSHYNEGIRDTRINLWSFYKAYLNKYDLSPKNEKLKKAILNDDEDIMHSLKWSCGNLNVYDMSRFKTSEWYQYISEVNSFGGHYKYRWGDIEVIGLFLYTFYEDPLCDLNLKERGAYYPQLPDISYAPSVKKKKKSFSNLFRGIFNRVN
jgi:hypothetical protein